MAITQERMLNVIHAGQSWRNAYLDLQRRTAEILQQQIVEDITKTEALAQLYDLPLRGEPMFADVIALDVEARYYETNARKNESAKLRARGQRHRDAETRGYPLQPRQPAIGGGTQRHARQEDIISEEEMRKILAGKGIVS